MTRLAEFIFFGVVEQADRILEIEGVLRIEGERADAEFLGPAERNVHTPVERRARVWAGNCIAIGLAGGFIEPLESTGLYLSDLASVMLAEHFPYTDTYESMAYRVNRILANRFYEILDFINMHYCLTRRSDSAFWQEVRRPERINDRLRAKLEYWRGKPPSPSDFEDQFFPGQPTTPIVTGPGLADSRPPLDTAGLWGHTSYEAILYGMDFLHAECDAWFGTPRPSPRVYQQVLEVLLAAKHTLPPHDHWLQSELGMPAYRR